ncbi:MAG TPA: hypothetical protein VMZ04_07860, partial [Anaerolineae bacterium]|nr:hypothetical protein [Anaerolineae bacterium]
MGSDINWHNSRFDRLHSVSASILVNKKTLKFKALSVVGNTEIEPVTLYIAVYFPNQYFLCL